MENSSKITVVYNGHEYTLLVRNDSTIWDLKGKLADETGVEPDKQIIADIDFGGRENNLKIKDILESKFYVSTEIKFAMREVADASKAQGTETEETKTLTLNDTEPQAGTSSSKIMLIERQLVEEQDIEMHKLEASKPQTSEGKPDDRDVLAATLIKMEDSSKITTIYKGNEYTVVVSNNSTVRDLKRKLADEIDIEPKKQRIANIDMAGYEDDFAIKDILESKLSDSTEIKFTLSEVADDSKSQNTETEQAEPLVTKPEQVGEPEDEAQLSKIHMETEMGRDEAPEAGTSASKSVLIERQLVEEQAIEPSQAQLSEGKTEMHLTGTRIIVSASRVFNVQLDRTQQEEKKTETLEATERSETPVLEPEEGFSLEADEQMESELETPNEDQLESDVEAHEVQADVPVDEGIKILCSPRPNKKLVVLDIGGTIMDKRMVGTPYKARIARPKLHTFLKDLYAHFDIGLWSNTKMSTIENCVKILNIQNKNYFKILFYADKTLSIKVHIPGEGRRRTKPLEEIYIRFPEFNNSNTVICDDRARNIFLNGNNGLLVSPYKYVPSFPDCELVLLGSYLKRIASEPDLSMIDHTGWENSVIEHNHF